MRELQFKRSGRLAWQERAAPALQDPGDAIVRPFVAGRCDGDTVPIHQPVSRALQAGMAVGAIDKVVGCTCGPVPFKGPFAIGHECVAEIVAAGQGAAAPSAPWLRVASARRWVTTGRPVRACR